MSQSSLIQANYFVLNETEHSSIEYKVRHYEDPRAASIKALKIVQKQYGQVPDSATPAVDKVLEIPASDVEGVATFYSQMFHQPVGRHIICICDNIVCYIGGHESVVGRVQKQLGIGLSQITADRRFTLLPVYCLGNYDRAPALVIGDSIYGDACLDGVAKLLRAYV